MLFADCGVEAQFHDAPQRTSSDVWAAWLVAEILFQLLFATVRSLEARLN
jgi:hypothetical protein